MSDAMLKTKLEKDREDMEKIVKIIDEMRKRHPNLTPFPLSIAPQVLKEKPKEQTTEAPIDHHLLIDIVKHTGDIEKKGFTDMAKFLPIKFPCKKESMGYFLSRLQVAKPLPTREYFKIFAVDEDGHATTFWTDLTIDEINYYFEKQTAGVNTVFCVGNCRCTKDKHYCSWRGSLDEKTFVKEYDSEQMVKCDECNKLFDNYCNCREYDEFVTMAQQFVANKKLFELGRHIWSKLREATFSGMHYRGGTSFDGTIMCIKLQIEGRTDKKFDIYESKVDDLEFMEFLEGSKLEKEKDFVRCECCGLIGRVLDIEAYRHTVSSVIFNGIANFHKCWLCDKCSHTFSSSIKKEVREDFLSKMFGIDIDWLDCLHQDFWKIMEYIVPEIDKIQYRKVEALQPAHGITETLRLSYPYTGGVLNKLKGNLTYFGTKHEIVPCFIYEQENKTGKKNFALIAQGEWKKEGITEEYDRRIQSLKLEMLEDFSTKDFNSNHYEIEFVKIFKEVMDLKPLFWGNYDLTNNTPGRHDAQFFVRDNEIFFYFAEYVNILSKFRRGLISRVFDDMQRAYLTHLRDYCEFIFNIDTQINQIASMFLKGSVTFKAILQTWTENRIRVQHLYSYITKNFWESDFMDKNEMWIILGSDNYKRAIGEMPPLDEATQEIGSDSNGKSFFTNFALPKIKIPIVVEMDSKVEDLAKQIKETINGINDTKNELLSMFKQMKQVAQAWCDSRGVGFSHAVFMYVERIVFIVYVSYQAYQENDSKKRTILLNSLLLGCGFFSTCMALGVEIITFIGRVITHCSFFDNMGAIPIAQNKDNKMEREAEKIAPGLLEVILRNVFMIEDETKLKKLVANFRSENIMKDVVLMKNFASAMEYLLNLSWKCFEQGFSLAFGMPLITSDTQEVIGKAVKWMEETQAYIDVDRQKLMDTPSYIHTIKAHHKKGEEISTELLEKQITRTNWLPFFNLVKKMADLVETGNSVLKTGRVRIPPIGLLLYGKPGVGKSTLVQMIHRDVYAYYCKTHGIAFNPDALRPNFYERKVDNEYWEGYNNQFTVSVDDAFQITEKEIQTRVAMEAIYMLNLNPFPLHMAEVSLKANAFFDSKLVIYTSNNPEGKKDARGRPQRDERRKVDQEDRYELKDGLKDITTLMSLQDSGAFWRRFNCVCFVERNSFKKGEISMDDVKEDYTFRFYDPVNGRWRNTNRFSYDEFLGHILSIVDDNAKMTSTVTDYFSKPKIIKPQRLVLAQMMTEKDIPKDRDEEVPPAILKMEEEKEDESEEEEEEMEQEPRINPLVTKLDYVKDANRDFKQWSSKGFIIIDKEKAEIIPSLEKDKIPEKMISTGVQLCFDKTYLLCKHDAQVYLVRTDGFEYEDIKPKVEEEEKKLNNEIKQMQRTWRDSIREAKDKIKDFVKEHPKSVTVAITVFGAATAIIGLFKAASYFMKKDEEEYSEEKDYDEYVIGEPTAHSMEKSVTATFNRTRIRRVAVARKARMNKVQVAQMDKQAEQIMHHVLLPNYAFLKFSAKGYTYNVKGIFLFSRYCMTVSHPMEVVNDPETMLEIIPVSKERKSAIFRFKDLEIWRDEGADRMIIRVPPPFQPFKDIRMHFAPADFVEKADISSTMMLTPALGEKNILICRIRHSDNTRIVGDYSYAASADPNAKMLKTDAAIAYSHGAEMGDCGSMIVVNNSKMSKKILGHHVAGSPTEGGAAVDSFEEIQSIYETLIQEHPDDFPVAQGLEEKDDEHVIRFLDPNRKDAQPNFHYEGSVRFVGKVKKEHKFWFPTTHEFEKSEISGVFQKPTMMPSLLEKKDGLSPIQNIVDRYNLRKEFTEFPYPINEESLIEYVLSTIDDHVPVEETSILEGINGRKGFKHIGPIHFDTSAGFDPANSKPSGMKGSYQLVEQLEDGTYVPTAELVMQIKEGRAKMIEGKKNWYIATMCTKSERLKIEKVEKGLTRGFIIFPKPHLIDGRCLTQCFTENLLSSWKKNGITLGINPTSREWQEVLTSSGLEMNEVTILDADTKTADTDQNRRILAMTREIILRYHRNHGYTEEQMIRLSALLDNATRDFYILIGEDLVKLEDREITASGFFLTAVFQSIYYKLLALINTTLIVKETQANGEPVDIESQEEIYDHAKTNTHGDDTMLKLDKILRCVTLPKYIEMGSRLGHTITPGNKSTNVPDSMALNEVSYLKRGFVLRNNIMFAPMKIENILEVLNWRTKSLPWKEAIRQNADTVLIELAQHGPQVHAEYKQKINAVLKDQRITPIGRTYEEIINRCYMEETTSFCGGSKLQFIDTTGMHIAQMGKRLIKDETFPEEHILGTNFDKYVDIVDRVGTTTVATLEEGIKKIFEGITDIPSFEGKYLMAHQGMLLLGSSEYGNALELLSRYGYYTEILPGEIPEQKLLVIFELADKRYPTLPKIMCTFSKGERTAVWIGPAFNRITHELKDRKNFTEEEMQHIVYCALHSKEESKAEYTGQEVPNAVKRWLKNQGFYVTIKNKEVFKAMSTLVNKKYYSTRREGTQSYYSTNNYRTTMHIAQMEISKSETTEPASLEHIGVTTMTDINVKSIETPPKMQPPQTQITDPYEQQDVTKLLSRQYELPAFEWKGSDNTDDTLATFIFPKDLINQPKVIATLSKFTYFRAKIRLQLRVVATIYHYGYIMISWLPYQKDETSWKMSNIYTMSDCNSVLMSASTNSVVDITIPFVGPFDYIDMSTLSNVGEGTIGIVVVKVLNPLRVENATTVPKVVVTAFANFEQPEVAAFSTRDLLSLHNKKAIQERKKEERKSRDNNNKDRRLVAQMQREAEAKSSKGIISSALDAVTPIASFVSTLPGVGDYVKPATGLIKRGATLTKMFGLSKPNSVVNVEPVTMSTVNSMTNIEGLGLNLDLGTSPRDLAPNSPEDLGLEIDEMEIDYLKRRIGLFAVGSFDETLVSGEVITKFHVGPHTAYSVRNVSDTKSGSAMTPVSMMTQMFARWRGTMEYVVRISASPFQLCKIRIAWHAAMDEIPTIYPLTAGPGDIVNKIYDIKGDTIIRFSVPYLRPLPWLFTTDPWDEDKNETNCNGAVSISIVQPITSVDGVTHQTIGYSVWVKGGKSLEFNQPKDSVWCKKQYIGDLTGLATVIAQMETESNVTQDISAEDYPPLIPAIEIMRNRIGGEKIHSLKEMASRFEFVKTITLTDLEVIDTSPSADGTYLPRNRVVSGGAGFSPTTINLIEAWAMFRSGGTNYKLIDIPAVTPGADPKPRQLYRIMVSNAWQDVTRNYTEQGTWPLGRRGTVLEDFSMKTSMEVSAPWYSIYHCAPTHNAPTTYVDSFNTRPMAYCDKVNYVTSDDNISVRVLIAVKDDYRAGWFRGPPIIVTDSAITVPKGRTTT